MGRASISAPLLMVLVALPLSSGCRAFPGHPVRASAPRLAVAAAGPSGVAVPEPSSLAGEDAARSIFRGLDGVLGPLRTMQAETAPATRRPRMKRLRRMEWAVRKRYRRGGFGGAVRSVIALGITGRVPLSPQAMAALVLDPEFERQAFGAEEVQSLGTVFELPGVRRERYRVGLLRRGYGPLRFDLRFTCAWERRDDGPDRVYLRYDPDARPRPEHVTLFRGGCLLERDGAGTRVTEILILGTDLRLLPPLQTELEGMVEKELRDRADDLFERAWAGR